VKMGRLLNQDTIEMRVSMNQKDKEHQIEIDSLKEKLKNSRPIEAVDLTNVEYSTAAEDDSDKNHLPNVVA
jgi:aspartate aminotransferase-like enzyme